MNMYSEAKIRQNCPHCDPNSFALKHLLEETDNFRIVCDVHPLTKGHILIIPKKHLSCIGEYPPEIFKEFVNLYQKFSDFIKITYGAISSFEHGRIGQTVFHSHVQMFPFSGAWSDIIPEGKNNIRAIYDFKDLTSTFTKEGKYLFFSIEDDKWLVNTDLGTPGFFRNRFAKAMGNPLRGNWKKMSQDRELMKKAELDIKDLQNKWSSFRKYSKNI